MHYPIGAKGDGITNDTKAIQEALDKRGVVVLESGKTYYCGTLFFHSDTHLILEAGATLKASRDINDYYKPGTVDDDSNRRVGTPVTRKPAAVFLYALGEKNITISGEGRIDGSCEAFLHYTSPYHQAGAFYPRPTMVYFENCQHLIFSHVTFCNGPFWTLHTAGCENVLIEGITIDHPLDAANSDGIDPDHSRNVRIIGCDIKCADDCICLKNTAGNNEYFNTKNVVISDCTLCSTSAALKIGTEGVADFEDVVVSNCVIHDTNRGISIQIRDGGCVRNVKFSNIIIRTRKFSPEWWGTAEPIAITSFDRDDETSSGTISNVTFSNIDIEGENGIYVEGYEGKINNITFKDVDVRLVKTSKWPVEGHDLRPRIKEPMFRTEEIRALEFREAGMVTLENISVKKVALSDSDIRVGGITVLNMICNKIS